MSDIRAHNNNYMYSPPIRGEDSMPYKIEAHSSSNMKLERPKVTSADFSIALSNYSKYSNAEANKQLNAINNDIYKKAKKEKSNHEFNFKRYFTIFGILGLLTAAITYFSRGKK